jgi:hypothetical protein
MRFPSPELWMSDSSRINSLELVVAYRNPWDLLISSALDLKNCLCDVLYLLLVADVFESSADPVVIYLFKVY